MNTDLINIQGRRNKGPKASKRSLFIRTFGCQMNEYDSQKISKLLENDYSQVSEPDSADLIIINTCSVRDKPEQKLYSYLGELQALKKKNPKLLIGVGGCVAQQEGDLIVKRSKAVDFVFGTHNLSLVPSLIERRKLGHTPQVAVNYRDEWEDLPLGVPDNGRVSRFIAISRGCDKNCTYCIVPRTRGKEVSRNFEEILREVKIAVHGGVREVVFLGQTVNSYGKDLQPKRKFVELLEKVGEVDGVERIRFTSPHPQEVRSDFVELIVNNPKICRHIHMPLQSGSNSILRAMNRNYKRERYLEIISELKSRVPDIAITTDIIVGFPGETNIDFEETLEIVKAVEFDASYSFVFSPRPGTEAEKMEDPVPYHEKLERLRVLQALQDEITQKRLSNWVGREVHVLLDGPSKSDNGCLQGRTSQNIVVNLVEPSTILEPGDLVAVSIEEAGRYTLKGALASSIN